MCEEQFKNRKTELCKTSKIPFLHHAKHQHMFAVPYNARVSSIFRPQELSRCSVNSFSPAKFHPHQNKLTIYMQQTESFKDLCQLNVQHHLVALALMKPILFLTLYCVTIQE